MYLSNWRCPTCASSKIIFYLPSLSGGGGGGDSKLFPNVFCYTKLWITSTTSTFGKVSRRQSSFRSRIPGALCALVNFASSGCTAILAFLGEWTWNHACLMSRLLTLTYSIVCSPINSLIFSRWQLFMESEVETFIWVNTKCLKIEVENQLITIPNCGVLYRCYYSPRSIRHHKHS